MSELKARWLPPDQAARTRIVDALQHNLLVEAGAGSGKTTAMVQRLVALILTGTATVDQIVAVTFTRKAAAELRERFQEQLENAFRSAPPGSDLHTRARKALDNLDACILGTIHAFCGRLLRERPLEAGVPPDFRELHGAEEELLRRESWNRFLERVAGRQRGGKGSRLLARLTTTGISPRQLYDLYSHVSENADVAFRAPLVPPPSRDDAKLVWETLHRLMAQADQFRTRASKDEWDPLQNLLWVLRTSRDETRWKDEADIFNAGVEAVYGNKAVILRRWTGDHRLHDLIKDMAAEWAALDELDHPVRKICLRWLAHRYGYAIRLARAAAAFYAQERLRRGLLTFQDLLLRTSALLRDHPDICRELGERYRFLLIDEFQDTDPVQAEVLFRLASERPEVRTDWLALRPRRGALFVVGDPKQSIYRFRRADISLYLQVKQQFREFGEVLQLTANFRSTGAITRFVNCVFSQRFPPTDDPSFVQATFAELNSDPARVDLGRVASYSFPADTGRRSISITRPDSELLASWIRQRIDAGARQPSDFLLLTRTKRDLAQFAHALERQNVPYEISGAGIGMEEELHELILLLRALADPGNPVLTLATLEGMFFGIDHDTLHEHALAGGHFHLLSREKGHLLVDEALAQLQRMWDLAHTETADVAIPLIVQELGIIPYAAAGELGATRAGALLFALDVLRAGSLAGRTTLPEAIELLESTLNSGDSDAPLMPGAPNVVRIMNLHRAKGLEAPVVILANPIELSNRRPSSVLRRRPDGRADGWMTVFDSVTGDRRKPIARPLEWDVLEAEEQRHIDAEEDRLMYVAATRAAEELVIARSDRQDLRSVWKCFHEQLDDATLADPLTIELLPPRARIELNEPVEYFHDEIARCRNAREEQKRPAYRDGSVTARMRLDDTPLKRTRRRSLRALQLGLGLNAPPNATPHGYDRDGKPIVQLGFPLRADTSQAAEIPTSNAVLDAPVPDLAEARGPEWGTAAHLTLHAAARGMTGDALVRCARNALVITECPGDADGKPLWLDELIALVEAMQSSPLWQRASRAKHVLYEVPFEIALPPDEWNTMSAESSVTTELLSGRIDLAFEEHDGWVIADYKTDAVEAKVLRTRIEQYRKQVDVYAACWQRITGAPVKEKQLVFTAPGVDAVIW